MANVARSLTLTERLEIELRNEKIRRVEDYVVYQSQLNGWKYQNKHLQKRIDQLEEIYQGTDNIVEQHHDFQKEEYKKLQTNFEELEADLEEREEDMLILEQIISVVDKMAKVIQAFYNFKSVATD